MLNLRGNRTGANFLIGIALFVTASMFVLAYVQPHPSDKWIELGVAAYFALIATLLTLATIVIAQHDQAEGEQRIIAAIERQREANIVRTVAPVAATTTETTGGGSGSALVSGLLLLAIFAIATRHRDK